MLFAVHSAGSKAPEILWLQYLQYFQWALRLRPALPYGPYQTHMSPVHLWECTGLLPNNSEKRGFGKSQHLSWPRGREEAQRPVSSPDRWFSPEALNTGINQDTATASTLALLTAKRRSFHLSVSKKVIVFRGNNTHMEENNHKRTMDLG